MTIKELIHKLSIFDNDDVVKLTVIPALGAEFTARFQVIEDCLEHSFSFKETQTEIHLYVEEV